jgi:diaminohydroxyphosphoribosylaminopyrimidine deaminase / 5-amino-6-(5-phosphoribosylamino)uracil reductase
MPDSPRRSPATPAQTASSADAGFMRRALDLAALGWGQTAPNPMVGAVVVRSGEIVGEGYHAEFGGEHAEVIALRDAGERARGSTVYVTLEPCNRQGKTPPCVDALIAAGVRRVVAAVRDPSTMGGGAERLEERGIRIDFGVEAEDAFELNRPFFHALESDRPWVTLKLAISIDGAIADAARAPGWITGPAARREVQRMRANSDAIGVGLGTIRIDNPALTVREVTPPRVPPARVVFTRRGMLPQISQVALSAADARTIVVGETPDLAHSRSLMQLGVEVVTATSLDEALRALKGKGIRSLLVEGGAELAGALWAASLVDRLVIFQAPVVLGAGALGAFQHVPPVAANGAPRLRILRRQDFGDDLMTVYAPPDR